MLQKRLFFLHFQFLLASLRKIIYMRTAVINYNIDIGSPGHLNLIFANQFKSAFYNNI